MSHTDRLKSIDHHGLVVACADCPVCGLAYVVDSRAVEAGEEEAIAFVATTDALCPQCVAMASSMPALYAVLELAASTRGTEDAPSTVILDPGPIANPLTD